MALTKAKVGVLATDSVDTAQIAAGAVDTAELATDAVTTVKIADAQVTAAKLAAGAAFSAGMLQMWAGSDVSVPTGWLLCDGSVVSQTTYADLYAAIGANVFGTDSGGNFTLPDYRDNMPYGKSGTVARGATGGSADAIVVSHTHTMDAVGSHTHTQAGNEWSGSAGGNGDGTGTGASTGSGGAHTPGINSAGSSGTGANLPPYVGINFIIKT